MIIYSLEYSDYTSGIYIWHIMLILYGVKDTMKNEGNAIGKILKIL